MKIILELNFLSINKILIDHNNKNNSRRNQMYTLSSLKKRNNQVFQRNIKVNKINVFKHLKINNQLFKK